MMNILRTTPSFYPHVTGPAYQAYRISAGLEDRGHTSPIVTTDVIPDDNPGYPPELEGTEFPFDMVRHKPLFSVDQYWVAPGVLKDAIQRDYDVVHAHSYHNALKDVMYPIAQGIRRKPLVVHVHGSFGEASSDPTLNRTFQYSLYDAVFKRVTMNAAAVVVSTEQERSEAEEFGIPEDKIRVIPVGKEPETYTAMPRTPPDDRVRVLFVGRLAPRRNVEMLIEAVSTLDRNDVELRIVGGEGKLSGAEKSNYVEQLREKVRHLNVEDSVTFTGALYGEDLIREFRSAHIFANPTHYENFGQATLEAAFAGLPLISTPTGVAPELIRGNETGELVDNFGGMTEAIDELIDNTERRRVYGKNAQRLAQDRYRWTEILDQYEQLYKQILAKT